MTAFVGRMFNKKTFEKDFALVTQVDGVRGKNITMPDGIRSVLPRRRCLVLADFFGNREYLNVDYTSHVYSVLNEHFSYGNALVRNG